eukprot:TRINITY_DN6245_c0_g1_i1.p1 TRINITY_DN6245_c0_g1~~TRINITY_DN6245_c0_g1_i1.p1  ORF type:complete len:286 (+),score=16.08 TRINITY_DN6245_c0_g1_i1:61-918(+)
MLVRNSFFISWPLLCSASRPSFQDAPPAIADFRSRQVLMQEDSEESAGTYVLTNRKTSTLQGRLARGDGEDVHMSCSFPACSRAASCRGAECCSHQMFEAVSTITDYMKKADIDHVLLFGTLLGAYRDHDIIPWTGDIDIGIFSADVPKIVAQHEIPWSFGYTDRFQIPRGCENHHPGFPGVYKSSTENASGFPFDDCMAQNNPLVCSYYIDLYVLDDENHGGDIADACLSSNWRDGVQKRGQLLKTKVTMRGKQFNAPANIERCLRADYGNHWRTPDPEHSFKG